MAGTKAGGAKAAATNKQKSSVLIDGKLVEIEPGTMYQVIGALGGKNGTTGGFASTTPCECLEIDDYHFKRQCAGKKGGLKSRRTSAKAKDN